MDEWRNNFKGIRYFHEPTNLLIYGAIDDVWVDAAFRLGDRDLKMMSRIVRAQMRRMEQGGITDVGVEAIAEERAVATA